jgi:hypothetical protein
MAHVALLALKHHGKVPGMCLRFFTNFVEHGNNIVVGAASFTCFIKDMGFGWATISVEMSLPDKCTRFMY